MQTVAKSNIGKYLFFLVQIQLRYHRIDLIICHLYGKQRSDCGSSDSYCISCEKTESCGDCSKPYDREMQHEW